MAARSTRITRWSMRSTVVAAGVTATRTGSLQHRVGELGDLPRHGGREEQRLPLGRQLADDAADVVDEAHVEHAVGFVEHEHLDAGRGWTARCCIRSSRRPGVATRTSTPFASARICGLMFTPPMASATRRAQVAAVGLEAVDDLRRQLARRAQHQHAAASWAARAGGWREVIEDRQRERGGLAGAGLGDADDVAAVPSLAGWSAPGSASGCCIVRQRGLW